MKRKERSIDYSRHPSFDEYVLFLRQSIKLPCQNCLYIRPTIRSHAFEVLDQAAFFNERHTKITGIDAEVEEWALLEAQTALLDEVEECGNRVAPEDTTRPDFDKALLNLILNSGTDQAQVDSTAPMPFTEDCDLRLRNQQRLQ
jgi:hypothetical protein